MKPDIPEEIQKLAEYRSARCRALGNTQRVLILWLLKERKRTVSELAQAIGVSVTNTYRHLSILGFHNLVEGRQDVDGFYYHVSGNELTRNCPVIKDRPKDVLMKTNQNSA